MYRNMTRKGVRLPTNESRATKRRSAPPAPQERHSGGRTRYFFIFTANICGRGDPYAQVRPCVERAGCGRDRADS